ncbi:hypothetical protein ACFVTT_25545 [Streptomyces niveus]|uniref:hypothetical protein n=1 Tax=Streptomyces niveus TaxID=193462 RepID=UPI003445CB8C
MTNPELGLPVTRAHHLDPIYPPHETKNWIRLDDEGRTGLIELRFTTITYTSLRPDSKKTQPHHQEMAETIRARVEAVLAC